MTKIVRLRHADASAHEDINRLLSMLSAGKTSCTLTALNKILADKHIEMWVVRDGKEIVGTATLIEFPMLSGSSADVEDVVVDDRYRGQGLGKALMVKLIKRAKARKAYQMELTSKPSRVAANKLYQKLGFKLRETNSYRMKL